MRNNQKITARKKLRTHFSDIFRISFAFYQYRIYVLTDKRKKEQEFSIKK